LFCARRNCHALIPPTKLVELDRPERQSMRRLGVAPICGRTEISTSWPSAPKAQQTLQRELRKSPRSSFETSGCLTPNRPPLDLAQAALAHQAGDFAHQLRLDEIIAAALFLTNHRSIPRTRRPLRVVPVVAKETSATMQGVFYSDLTIGSSPTTTAQRQQPVGSTRYVRFR